MTLSAIAAQIRASRHTSIAQACGRSIGAYWSHRNRKPQAKSLIRASLLSEGCCAVPQSVSIHDTGIALSKARCMSVAPSKEGPLAKRARTVGYVQSQQTIAQELLDFINEAWTPVHAVGKYCSHLRLHIGVCVYSLKALPG